MINTGKSFDVHDYIEVARRRIWFFVIPFVVIAGASVLYAFFSPKEYRATTLVMVTPQKVPEDYVRATVTSGIEDRLQSIAEAIMSRSHVEKIISKFNLYAEQVNSLRMEDIVEEMKKNIQIEINEKEKKGSSFKISYVGRDPITVTRVANELAALFIEENLKYREQQAQGTTEFLSNELNAIRAKLGEQETEITQFKKGHMGELPEQREANLRVLEQLRMQYDRIGMNMRILQDQRSLIQRQLSDLERFYLSDPSSAPSSAPLGQNREDPTGQELADLRKRLVDLQAHYTEFHPDVISTRKKIANLEGKVERIPVARTERTALENKSEPSQKARTGPKLSPRFKEVEDQLIANEMEMKRLQQEESNVKSQMARYLERIENTASRELAMNLLTRDYQNTKESYQSLLKKSEEAKQAENLERRQKGEQFRVIDPATVPDKPFKPNVPKTLLYGLLFGVASGLAMVFVREQLDRSFRDAEDLEKTSGFKVLANIPRIE